MNWIRQSSRLAIYLRDGLACAYCGDTVENGAILSLDHIVCRSHGGGNGPKNLVTCCKRCNSARGNRPLAEFIRSVASYLNHGITPESIAGHVRNCRARRVPRELANQLIAKRGSVSSVLNNA